MQVPHFTTTPTFRVIACTLAFCASPAYGANDAHGPAVGEIKKAWEDHASKITSLQYQCRIVKRELVTKGGSGDPLAPQRNGAQQTEPVTLTSDLTFSMSGAKVATLRSGEVFWDGTAQAPRVEAQRVCFDGTKGQSLLPGPHFPMSQVTDGKIPIDLARSADLMGMWLGYSPLRFFDFHDYYSLDSMEVVDTKASWKGQPTIKATLKSGNGTPLECVLNLEPKTFRVVRLLHVAKGVTRRGVEVEYVDNEKCGWSVSRWSFASYSSNNVPRMRVDGNVIKCSVNEPIPDAVFEIDTPPGTHLDEGGQFAVQEEDGVGFPRSMYQLE